MLKRSDGGLFKGSRQFISGRGDVIHRAIFVDVQRQDADDTLGFKVTRWWGDVGVGLNFQGPSATSTTLEILMGRGETPGRAEAYDARGVQQSLRARF